MNEANPLPTNLADREAAVRLFEAIEDARVARANHSVRVLEGNDGNAMRCERTGIPICEGDETVEDLETGEVWLRAALGLPARDILDDDPEEVMDDESEYEAA
jgi:hypothetical protein